MIEWPRWKKVVVVVVVVEGKRRMGCGGEDNTKMSELDRNWTALILDTAELPKSQRDPLKHTLVSA